MYIAAFPLISASCIALTKDNLKARLAYSTVSQLAYIVLGASLATSMGVIGGGMQLIFMIVMIKKFKVLIPKKFKQGVVSKDDKSVVI